MRDRGHRRLQALLTDALENCNDGQGEGDRPDSLSRRAQALAHLEPKRAADWLIEHEDEVRQTVGARTIASTVNHLLEISLKESLTIPAPEAHQLLQRYIDLVEPETVARLTESTGSEPSVARSDRLDLVERALDRKPDCKALLRTAVELATAEGEDEKAHRLLTRLGRVDPSPATLSHVRRQRATLRERDLPEVRVALLSSFTIDPLADFLDLECRDLGMTPELYVAPFDSWSQEVIDSGSGLRTFEPEIAFLFVDVDDLVPELAGDPPHDQLQKKGESAVDRVAAMAERFSAWSDGLLVIGSFYSVYPDPDSIHRGQDRPSRSEWLAGLNQRLSEELGSFPNIHVMDLKDVLLRRPGGELDDPKMRHLGSIRFGPGVLEPVAHACARYIAPFKGLTRKCVVVDLDNTLWGGIVGEDGLHGIHIGKTSPGSEYLEFQQYLKSLTNRGILLAINSKNNRNDALPVFREREAMVLDVDDFSAMRINWNPKPQNMRELAAELNIGLDSMIFLDDNPHEREMMRQMLPQVQTVDLPRDPALYRSTVEALPQLDKLVVTEVDRMRVQQYKARKEREDFRENASSIEEYLHSLNIEVEIRQATESSLMRVHQLFQRTNQFNLTTRRYDAQELRSFSDDPDTNLYTLRSRDRYGDHGLVACALVRKEDARWRIDNFIMSCRVIGHEIENALLAAITEDARTSGATQIIGEFIESEKNAPASELYEENGFVRQEQASAEDDEPILWSLSLDDDVVDFPDWIQRAGEMSHVA